MVSQELASKPSGSADLEAGGGGSGGGGGAAEDADAARQHRLLEEALKGDMADAEARAARSKGDITTTWSLFLGFKAFCLSFTATATKMGCGDWWAPVTLLTAGLAIGAPAMYVAAVEHDKQRRRASACYHQLKVLQSGGGADAITRRLIPAGATLPSGDVWQLGPNAGVAVARSAGALEVHHRRWPGAVAVAGMGAVWACIFVAINRILCK